MDTNNVVKSVSIENLVNQRKACIEILKQAHELVIRAREISKVAHLSNVGDLFNTSGHGGFQGDFSDVNGFEKVAKYLDKAAWKYLVHESGLLTFMDAKAKSEWQHSIQDGKYPELTKENITETFRTVNDSRQDLFERGIINCFKNLSWDYKTNKPFLFGKRIIIDRICDYRFNGYSFYYKKGEVIDDLMRCFCVFDGKPEADHRQGIFGILSEAAKKGNHDFANDYLSIKWYKKGSAHITFKRQDLVDKMNKVLVKHFPNALACDK